VGETAADFLNINLNFGLTGTSIVTGVLLAIVLFFQLRATKYIPSAYWSAVTLVSVFGTLVTDNLSDKGLPLETSTLIFGVLLALTFLGWYISEKTLSIHSIFTRRREVFYWTAILFTFALGTATGDLVSEGLGVGYLMTGALVAAIIAITAVAWRLRLNPVLSFWIIYILTRPLGASIGDLLSQPPKYGGLGLGPTITSFIFLGGILGIVTYLSITRRDVIGKKYVEEVKEDEQKGGLWQTGIVLALFLILGGTGYQMRHAALTAEITAPSGTNNATSTPSGKPAPLGDLSSFITIAQAILDSINKGDWAGANSHVNDLEYTWDNAQARLKPMNGTAWNHIDGQLDTVFREVRAVHPNAQTAAPALQNLLTILNNP
jgi:uncharacterized membrane-anchored protein